MDKLAVHKTLREHYVGLAMNALIMAPAFKLEPRDLARDSVVIADLLLDELNKTKAGEK